MRNRFAAPPVLALVAACATGHEAGFVEQAQ